MEAEKLLRQEIQRVIHLRIISLSNSRASISHLILHSNTTTIFLSCRKLLAARPLSNSKVEIRTTTTNNSSNKNNSIFKPEEEEEPEVEQSLKFLSMTASHRPADSSHLRLLGRRSNSRQSSTLCNIFAKIHQNLASQPRRPTVLLHHDIPSFMAMRQKTENRFKVTSPSLQQQQ